MLSEHFNLIVENVSRFASCSPFHKFDLVSNCCVGLKLTLPGEPISLTEGKKSSPIDSLNGSISFPESAARMQEFLASRKSRCRRLEVYWEDAESYPNCTAWALSEDDGLDDLIDAVNDKLGEMEDKSLSNCLLAIAEASGLPSVAHIVDGSYIESLIEGDMEHDLMAKMAEIQSRCDMKQRWRNVEKKRQTEVPTLNQSCRQIFTSKESYMILETELLSMYDEYAHMEYPHVLVEPVNDNVHLWSLKLLQFDPQSRICKDLLSFYSNSSDRFVEFRVLYTEDLHPFYPPRILLRRPALAFNHPHLRITFNQALLSHPRLRLEQWNPTITTKGVIWGLTKFIEKYAALDTFACATSEGGNGFLHPLEQHLLLLASTVDHFEQAWTGIHGAWDDFLPAGIEGISDHSKVIPQIESTASFKQTPPQLAAGCAGIGKGWAKGTGYGSGSTRNSRVWNAAASQAAQQARDAQQQNHLMEILKQLREQRNTPNTREGDCQNKLRESDDGDDEAGSPHSAPTGNFHSLETVTISPLSEEQLYTLLVTSCIGWLFKTEFRTSFQDMCNRIPYYQSLFALLDELLHYPRSLVDMNRRGDISGALIKTVHTGALTAKKLSNSVRTGSLSVASAFQSPRPRSSKLRVQHPSSCAAGGAGGGGPVPGRECVDDDPRGESLQCFATEASAVLDRYTLWYKSLPTSVVVATTTTVSVSSSVGSSSSASCDSVLPVHSHCPKLSPYTVCSQTPSPTSTIDTAPHGNQENAVPLNISSTNDLPVTTNPAASVARVWRASADTSLNATGVCNSSTFALDNSQYKRELEDLIYSDVNIAGGHHFAKESNSEAAAPTQRCIRLVKEISGLPTSLPLTASSAVFVRTDETRSQLWR
eukprot:GHVQ01024226.1.p1 GENE.GHVQ01024226.1~~GHVQ01024226.1.p1  ORF type:complete len:877 (+),score=130.31 GHVQ01024226.1:672-3302(+)